MKINKITKIKDKYKIELENKTLTISSQSKDEFNLYINKDIDKKLIFEIEKYEKIQKYFLLASKRLLVNDYSPNKAKEFLIKKGASKSEAQEAIKKLEKYQLLNEDELIKRITDFCDAKHYGFNRIISMLKDRQVSESKIKKLQSKESREIKEATLMSEKLVKRFKNKNTSTLKRNVYSSLIRYGFDENIASLCASKVFNSPKNELNVLKLDYLQAFSSYSRKVKGKELKEKIIKSLLSKGYRISDIEKILKESKT